MIQKIKVDNVELKINLPRANDFGSTFQEVFGKIDEYEFHTKIKPNLNKDDIVIDCGGHIGLFSLLVFQYVGKVYTFEADKANYEYLKMNLELNNIDNVIAFNKALAEKSGVREFLVSCKSPACNSFFKYPFFNDEGKNAIVRKVDCISLPEIFELNKINFCKLLKMDIEGAEFEVLLNLPESIFKKIGIIILESHNEVTKFTEKDLITKLEENNFKTKILFGSGKDNKEFMSIRAVKK